MGKNLAVLLAVVLFLASGGEAMGSIVEKIMFPNNKEYAANIDMETYLISEDKLAEILSNHWEQKITQETHRQLYGKTVYFVVRVRNKGDLAAWGTLACRVDGDNFGVCIAGVPFGNWFSYIVPRGGGYISKNDDTVPAIEIKWTELYTK